MYLFAWIPVYDSNRLRVVQVRDLLAMQLIDCIWDKRLWYSGTYLQELGHLKKRHWGGKTLSMSKVYLASIVVDHPKLE
jgi:hypothetical protein